jgi:hypothetical protein
MPVRKNFRYQAADTQINIWLHPLRATGSGSGMFYIRLRPSTAIGCGTKQ